MSTNDISFKGGYKKPNNNTVTNYDTNCIIPPTIVSENYGMRTNLAVNQNQMNDWRQICKAFAEKIDAELLFVNETSCGVQYKNNTFGHIYIDEMLDFLKENGDKS